MRKSKLALLVAALLLSTGCTVPPPPPAPVELKAYTLTEALTLCESLPEADIADCVTAAKSAWGQ